VIDSILLPNPLPGATGQDTVRRPAAPQKGTDSFAGILDAKLGAQGVKFSGHALERLKSRGISLSGAELNKLEGAVASVAAKGGKESLIMVGNAALVVSIKNRTVITAFDRQNLEGNVFTNIDSAAVF